MRHRNTAPCRRRPAGTRAHSPDSGRGQNAASGRPYDRLADDRPEIPVPRRNLAQGTPGVDNFVPFQFTSDYQERDIVYGGAQRLETIGREIRALFPLAKGISVQSECPIGLIGGDAWASKKIIEEMGLRVVSMWSGDGQLETMKVTHLSKLNLIHCYRSMNYIARHMEEAYGIPWMEYNFFGPTKIEASIRAIAKRFDATIQANAEKVIARHRAEMDAVIAKYRPRLDGKSVMLYVGGLRPRHVIGAYEDLGMRITGTGYEFGHADDYQRTLPLVKDGTVIYDDATEHELEELVKHLKPDLVGAGVKEKYVFQKMGVPFRQMHSWDYSGPYHGYEGFPIFARDMDMAINSPTWKLVKDPFAA